MSRPTLRYLAITLLPLWLFLLSCGSNPASSPLKPPFNLQYTVASLKLPTNQKITPLALTYAGGAADSFTVAPALPVGLSIDRSTGTISGTPLVALPQRAYTITGYNAAGHGTASLFIEVVAPPVNLAYMIPALKLGVNKPLIRDSVTYQGSAADSFSVTPKLPSGLLLNKATGVISGMPTAAQSATEYVVTAHNGAGSASTTISISVIALPSKILNATTVRLVKGAAVRMNSLFTESAGIDSVSVTPYLPAGLYLDAATGEVFGTPILAQPPTKYKVMVHNVAGSASGTLSIEVVEPPTRLRYAIDTLRLAVKAAMDRDSAFFSGSAPDSFSVTPPLPEGMQMNKWTGAIYGTPTTAQKATTHTVAAHTIAGTATSTLVIDIFAHPEKFSYSQISWRLGVNLPISPAEVLPNDNRVDSFTVTPAFPEGLLLDNLTGTISGTPTKTQETKAYYVRAHNVAGSSSPTTTVLIEILAAPSELTYSLDTLRLKRSSAMTRDSAVYSGSPADSFTVEPPLPFGLNLVRKNGTIYGTPSKAQTESVHTIIAANPGGFCSTTVVISVYDPPASFYYRAHHLSCGLNAPIIPDTIYRFDTSSQFDVRIDSFTVAPVMPEGVVFDKRTGTITGTPTRVQDAVVYYVKGHNPAGTRAINVSIEVIAPPGDLSYADTALTLPQNVAMTRDSATFSGVVDRFTASPALPAGLYLDQKTGAVYGTPSVAQPATDHVIAATNGGGSALDTISITVIARLDSLAYATPALKLGKNIAMTRDSVTWSGSVPDSFTISPALPEGLYLDRITGAVYGMPSTPQDAKSHTVTAYNLAGSSSTTLSIEIVAPPTTLSYATPALKLILSAPMTRDSAVTTGGIPDSFTVSPLLPEGLAVVKSTGAIYGTPAIAQPATDYTVTAWNIGGSASTAVSIAVIGPPGTMTYASPTLTLGKNAAMTPDTATVSGSAPDSFTVSPSLPAGLAIDKFTGIISGTPATAQSATDYTVTGTNIAGSASTTVSISIVNTPSMLTYAATTLSLTLNTAMERDTVVYLGGTADSFTISPALPAGLSIVKPSGVIYGTPTVPHLTTIHTVTARNAAGFATAALTIGVRTIASGAWKDTVAMPKDSGLVSSIPTATTMTTTIHFTITDDSKYARTTIEKTPVSMYRSQFNSEYSDTSWTTVFTVSDTGTWVLSGTDLIATPTRAWTKGDDGTMIQVSNPQPDTTSTTGVVGDTWTLPQRTYTTFIGGEYLWTPVLKRP